MSSECEQGTPLTRRESTDDDDVVGTRREGVMGTYVRVNLPPELTELFEVLGEVASGGESDVLLVERLVGSERRRAALKIYRHGLEPDQEALAAIRGLPREHVVEIYDCGRSSAGWWEEQEYIEHGSLADLLAAEAPKLASERLRQVLVELTDALDAVHPVLHRDVKPTNVFVRTVEPLDLVLGDFGLARSTAFTHIVSTVAGSLAYQSPEALDGGASPARDWWAVGMIIAEAAMARHPFFDPRLGWPSAQEMRIALTTRPVPLDGIQDERVRLLCRGLLVRDPRRRWGATEVRTWLDGGSPHVADDTAASAAPHRAAAIQPFVFADQRCTTPEQLAPLLAQHWGDALRLISGAASEAPDYIRLVGWLQDHQQQPAIQILSGTHDRSVARRLFRLLRALDPDLPPTFRGYLTDRAGLIDLAERASGGDDEAADAVHEILNLSILGELGREDSYSEMASVEDGWRTQVELLAKLRAGLGDCAKLLSETQVQRLSAARLLLSQLDADGVSALSAITEGAEREPEFTENDALRTLFLEARGDGDQPARLLAALLLRDIARDELPRIRAAREAAARREREAREAAARQAQERRAQELRLGRQRILGGAGRGVAFGAVAGLIVGALAGCGGFRSTPEHISPFFVYHVDRFLLTWLFMTVIGALIGGLREWSRLW